MPDDAGRPDEAIRWVPTLPRKQLRDALRRPHAFDPPLRILAEEVLGADSTIDFVAVDPGGRIVLVLIGDNEDDAALLTRGLAQRAWVKPRLRDWLQLGPSLEISASAPVVAALLSPIFSPETRAAAEAVGPEVVELWVCRCVRFAPDQAGSAQASVLLEALSTRTRTATEPPLPSGGGGRFRSGLSEDDLGLSPEEVREFS
jgi:hypothetical protein